ncbi:hypothetical protein ACIQF6_05720 [Kitasatospora sp. NPDC092948]|uniref:hypothetical protein n=1 Tax=Kitasatospora sp. NPDC092948 TaxID=3364088 RepID=UPI00382B8946
MESEQAAPSTVAEAAGPRPRSGVARLGELRWFWGAALLLGYAVQIFFRLWLSRDQDYPVVSPDESDYLVMARVIAGLPTTEIPGNEVIPSGYSLLISPALRFAGGDPIAAYHGVMVINALISCLVLPLVYVALRRLDVPRVLAYLFGTVAVMLPPVVFYSQYAMSDTVLPALLLAWLIGLHGLLSDGPRGSRIRYGLMAGLAGGYSMVVHDRGGVVVALTGVVLLVVLVRNWAPRIATAVSLVALVGMFGLKQLMTAWMIHAIDGAHPSAVGNAVFKTLFHPNLLRRTVMRTIGHIWYFLTSTWGIAALAVVVCVVCVFGRKYARADRVVAFVMVALMCGIALAAAAGLPNDHRIDTIVYARYLSPLVPVFFVVGAAALYRLGRKRLSYLAASAVGLILVVTVLLLHFATQQFHKSYFILWALPDATFLSSWWSDDWGAFHAGLTTAVAVVVLGLVVGIRLLGGRRSAAATGAIGLALAVFACFATVNITDNVTRPNTSWRYGDATGFIEEAGIRPGDKVVMDFGFRWERRMTMAYSVLDGRVWTRELIDGEAPPAEANVAVVALWASENPAPAEESWQKAPAGWHVDRGVMKDGFVVWRRD